MSSSINNINLNYNTSSTKSSNTSTTDGTSADSASNTLTTEGTSTNSASTSCINGKGDNGFSFAMPCQITTFSILHPECSQNASENSEIAMPDISGLAGVGGGGGGGGTGTGGSTNIGGDVCSFSYSTGDARTALKKVHGAITTWVDDTSDLDIESRNDANHNNLKTTGDAASSAVTTLKSNVQKSQKSMENKSKSFEQLQIEAKYNYTISLENIDRKTADQSKTVALAKEANNTAAKQTTDAKKNSDDVKTNAEKTNEAAEKNVEQGKKGVKQAEGNRKELDAGLQKAINAHHNAERDLALAENKETSLSQQSSKADSDEQTAKNNYDKIKDDKTVSSGKKTRLKGLWDAAKGKADKLKKDLELARKDVETKKGLVKKAKEEQDKAAKASGRDAEAVENARQALEKAEQEKRNTFKTNSQNVEQAEENVKNSQNNEQKVKADNEHFVGNADKLVNQALTNSENAENKLKEAEKNKSDVDAQAKALDAQNEVVLNELAPALENRSARADVLYKAWHKKEGAQGTDDTNNKIYAALNGEKFDDTCARLGISKKDQDALIKENSGIIREKNGTKYFVVGKDINIPENLQSKIKNGNLMTTQERDKEHTNWDNVDTRIKNLAKNAQQPARNKFYKDNQAVLKNRQNNAQAAASSQSDSAANIQAKQPANNAIADERKQQQQNLAQPEEPSKNLKDGQNSSKRNEIKERAKKSDINSPESKKREEQVEQNKTKFFDELKKMGISVSNRNMNGIILGKTQNGQLAIKIEGKTHILSQEQYNLLNKIMKKDLIY